MKVTYYTIGEVSKLANISIKALRYYDKIDLFKPKYVDPDTNYRYYKDSQLYHLDLIKSLKYIGTPLEEIRKAQDLETDELMHFLSEQEQQVRDKIDFLMQVEHSISNIKKHMQRQLEFPVLGEVYVVEEEEIRILKTGAGEIVPESLFNSSYSKLKKMIESADGFTNTSYGAIFSFQPYIDLEEISYSHLFTPVLTNNQIVTSSPDMELTTIPEGKYVRIAFHFSEENYFPNFQKLAQYIDVHKLIVDSDVYEFFIPIHYSPKKHEEYRVEMRVKLLTEDSQQ